MKTGKSIKFWPSIQNFNSVTIWTWTEYEFSTIKIQHFGVGCSTTNYTLIYFISR